MKNLFICLLALTSLSAFADELNGLTCRTEYLLHEVSRTPYNTERMIMRKRLLGGKSVLGYTPISNVPKQIREEFNLVDSTEAILYILDVREDISNLTIALATSGVEIVLLENQQFKTNVGFSGLVPFGDLLQFGTQKVINVLVTCLPSYHAPE